MEKKWYNVGKVVNTHGIKGEVRVLSITDFPEIRYQPNSTLYLFLPNESEPIELIVRSHRTHKQFHLLSFEGYDSIESVEKMKGGMLKICEDQLMELDEGEYYFDEIIGCRVVIVDGEEIGVIKEILTPGANDVWVVKGKDGKDLLIPYIDPIVKKVDVEEKTVIIEPMEGLFS